MFHRFPVLAAFAGLLVDKLFAAGLLVAVTMIPILNAQEPSKSSWRYTPEQLSPFWEGDTMDGESVLFIKDEDKKGARASVLFPIREVLSVRSSDGMVTYKEGVDYIWKPDSREIVLPSGSSIPAKSPGELRRPPKSQKYELTHRDGNGEILFGGELQYAAMQTCITYRHSPGQWESPTPHFDPRVFRHTVKRLVSRQPLTIVTLGDSISAGANASALYDSPPFQPSYPELVRRHLAERFRNPIELTNLSIGGIDTAAGLKLIEQAIAAKPQLVIVAFGMNDAAGRPAQSYRENIKSIIDGIREKLPDCEFVLVAPMLGNRDWVRLKPELFPQYRDALKEFAGLGIAVADLTSIWESFLSLKRDWDQTGNGVNHPNDFGHRVYAQVITTLLDPRGQPDSTPEPPINIQAGPLKWTEQRLLGNYTYSYACAAADLDGDGDLDLTSSDAEPNSNLYVLENDGKAQFRHSFIQKYAGLPDQPIRLERHSIGDINRDGKLDVAIVDNLKSDIRWFENPGLEIFRQPWKLHRVAQPNEVPGSYDVALADLDADGDLDIACSSWNGQRFDWFENLGSPGIGREWRRHLLAEKIGETRTIAVTDLNRDGKPDILGTARTTNQVLWFENVSEPDQHVWTKRTIDESTLAPAHGHPVDLDSDGDVDVVMAFGIASPAPVGAALVGPAPVGPANAHQGASHQICWYENVGRPGSGAEWKKHLIAGSFRHGFEAVAGDLDGDGDQDVVATGWSPAGQISWFENTGDPAGEWKEHSIKTSWSNAVTLVLADLNQDRRLDIVACAERGANELRWWRNDGK